jgi:hypothetical protein
MMMLIIIMGPRCKRETNGGISRTGERKRKGY